MHRAEEWRWDSLWRHERGPAEALLTEWPVDRPRDWIAAVNESHTGAELEAVRACIARGIPFGSERWKTETADRLGLTAALKPIGRPRKKRSPKKST